MQADVVDSLYGLVLIEALIYKESDEIFVGFREDVFLIIDDDENGFLLANFEINDSIKQKDDLFWCPPKTEVKTTLVSDFMKTDLIDLLLPNRKLVLDETDKY